MIPILYSYDETNFTSNGVGRLSECLTCTVTEEVNGIYECEFTYPITGKYFNDLINGPDGVNLGIIAVTHDHNGDIQPFDIYKFSAPINGIVTFNARHISYRLINQIVGYADGESVTNTSYLFTSVLSGPGTVVFPTGQHFSFVDHANYTASEGHSMSWRGAVSARQLMFSGYRTGEEYGTESIINAFPGEFKWDKFTGHYYRSRGSYNGVQIRYGKNMLDISRGKDVSGIVNAIFPFWISKDDPSIFQNGTLQVSPHAGSDVRAASLDLSDEFDTRPTAAQLNAQAMSYMSKNSTWRGQENITVNMVDLYDTNPGFEKITLGDYVDVIYTDLGVVAEQVEVISVTFDALAERFTEIQCGQFPTTYADVITGMVPSGGSSGGGSSITVDDALSSTSTNPVQNRVINAALSALSTTLGALIESGGTTANGYFRFENGVQVCFGNYSGSSQPTTQVGNFYILSFNPGITFAKPFISAPNVIASPQATYSIIAALARNATGITSIDLCRPNSGNLTPRFMWVAVGWWKS